MKKHGVTVNTASNILFGAGVWFKNFIYNTTKSEWEGDVLGATLGGSKLELKNELKDIEIDGATVKIKGYTVKVGTTAIADVNFAEFSKENVAMVGLLTNVTDTQDSDVINGYDLLKDKPMIEEGDYIQNLAFVGRTTTGREVIVIFDYALCTSGLSIDAKAKENSVFSGTFEAYAECTGDLDVLPVKIYFENSQQTTQQNSQQTTQQNSQQTTQQNSQQ